MKDKPPPCPLCGAEYAIVTSYRWPWHDRPHYRCHSCLFSYTGPQDTPDRPRKWKRWV